MWGNPLSSTPSLNAYAQSANYPFCTIDPNVGVVAVPDERLDRLADMYHPEKYTPATIEFVDIAGLVRGASKGEGLGNKFLANIREVDAIVHVVRCFEDDDIVHVDGSVDPLRDIETIHLELIFSDMEMLERRIDKTAKLLKGDKACSRSWIFQTGAGNAAAGHARPRGLLHTGGRGNPSLCSAAHLQARHLRRQSQRGGFRGGDPASSAHYRRVAELAGREHAEVLPICAQMEADIADMSAEEKGLFSLSWGWTAPAWIV